MPRPQNTSAARILVPLSWAILLICAGCVGMVGSTGTGGGGAAAGGGTAGAGGGTAGAGGGTAGAGGGTAGAGGGTAGAGGGTAGGAAGAGGGSPLVLTPGVWKNVTPAALMLGSCGTPSACGNYGTPSVTIDPSNPLVIYLAADQRGLWKSTDGAATWKRLGDPAGIDYNQTTYLDSPFNVRVDPNNSQHLYATQGVRGMTLGFWVSNDGGETWTRPQGFRTVAAMTTSDVTSISVDPSDFKHVILSSHSAWPNMGNAGILETKDGGNTWIVHPPDPGFTSATMGVHILYNPALGIGDSKTWLVATEGAGFFRTTNSGATWTKVSSSTITHGGNDIYYTKSGVLYAGAAHYPVRSTDNGATWTQVTVGLVSWYYYSVQGDGTTLYTQLAFTGDNGGQGNRPYMTSPEASGTTWSEYDPLHTGAQTFSDGPYVMRFDPVNRIMYSANWDAGLWALKVVP